MWRRNKPVKAKENSKTGKRTVQLPTKKRHQKLIGSGNSGKGRKVNNYLPFCLFRGMGTGFRVSV
jgi:hypothetical protein